MTTLWISPHAPSPPLETPSAWHLTGGDLNPEAPPWSIGPARPERARPTLLRSILFGGPAQEAVVYPPQTHK